MMKGRIIGFGCADGTIHLYRQLNEGVSLLTELRVYPSLISAKASLRFRIFNYRTRGTSRLSGL
jgi:hypothetical protein